MVDTSKTSKDYELDLYVTSAEKIQRLEAEIARLKSTLKEITEKHLWADDEPNAGTMMSIARAALEEK